MPMSSPQMTRMFGLSPSLTAIPPRATSSRPSAAGKCPDTEVSRHHPDRVIWSAAGELNHLLSEGSSPTRPHRGLVLAQPATRRTEHGLRHLHGQRPDLPRVDR